MEDTTRLTTGEVAARCRQESDHSDPVPASGFSACWELFRRAIVENDQQAWQALYVQYRRFIGKWGVGTDLDLDDLVTVVFDRFWRGVRNHDFTSRFPTITEVGRFLKWCAKTEAIDRSRRREYQQRIRGRLVEEGQEANIPSGTSDARIFAQELRDYLYSRLQDEEERLVFYLSWVLDLRPREIVELHPQRFADARSVSRIKERILWRLRGDPQVQRWRAL